LVQFIFAGVPGFSPAGNDGLGMHSLMDKFLSFSEKLAGENSNSGGSVSDFFVLSFGDFDEDFGSRIIDMHGAENGGAIIGDSNGLVFGASCNGYKDFIHTSGAEGSFDKISDSNGTDE
jgi:hypothetical protein